MLRTDLLEDYRKIIRNSSWLFLGELFNRGIFFIISLIIARNFLTEEYGIFSFSLSFVSLFIVLSDLGLSTLIIREVSKDESVAKKYIENISLIKILLSILTFLVIILSSAVFVEGKITNQLVILFSIYLIINSFNEFIRSIFKSFEKFKFDTISKITQGIILLMLVLFLINGGYSIVTVSYSFIISSIISLIVSILILEKKFFKLNFKNDLIFWKKILKESWPFAGVGSLTFVYYQIDQIMIKIFKGNFLLGLYVYSYNIYGIVYTITNLISGVLYPRIVRLISEGKYERFHKSYLRISIILGLIATISLFFLSDFLIKIVYDIESRETVTVLKIISIGIFFKFLSNTFCYPLSALGFQKKILKILVITSILNIFLNTVLIPYIGIIGAAISTLISEIGLFVLSFKNYREIKNGKYLGQRII